MDAATDCLYAVITGDVVRSRAHSGHRAVLLSSLKKALSTAHEFAGPGSTTTPFSLFRGDSFQCVLSKPEKALLVALFVRSRLLELRVAGRPIDVKLGIGVGMIDYLDEINTNESDGEAFHLSGSALDQLKTYRRLAAHTPWAKVNDELDVTCALLDAVVARWTRTQAIAVSLALTGKTQRQIGNALKNRVTQPAVQQRLETAGLFAIELACGRFRELVLEHAGRQQGAVQPSE